MQGTLINAVVLKYSQMNTLLRTLHTPAQRRRRNPPNRAGWHDERCGNLRQRQAQHVAHARQIEASRVAKIKTMRQRAPTLPACNGLRER
ncbi:hypothetical protein [Burkholderia metallica]|uniref:hypothetical protein n=1 Tax=Burkholderia metallica TaxID=488729 RepID=UPI001CF151E2|nr:hypothetical protein [Burkholderia metallica]MCA8002863.1 hypothetical protein [Burkholderia metallica]